jgi:hypothetical protein
MAQFCIHFPAALMTLLNEQVALMRKEQGRGVQPMGDLVDPPTLPHYDTFVANLMKSMDSPAQEFMHATIGMSGEAGELIDIAKKVWVYNKPITSEMQAHIVEELGDLRFYYQAMLNLFALTDEQIQAANITKLRKRYAEGKYSDAQAQARADKPEEQGLSAAGAKGTGPEAARKFMGQPQPLDLFQKVVLVTSGVLREAMARVTAVGGQSVTCELLEAHGPYAKGDVVSVAMHELTVVPAANQSA